MNQRQIKVPVDLVLENVTWIIKNGSEKKIVKRYKIKYRILRELNQKTIFMPNIKYETKIEIS